MPLTRWLPSEFGRTQQFQRSARVRALVTRQDMDRNPAVRLFGYPCLAQPFSSPDMESSTTARRFQKTSRERLLPQTLLRVSHYLYPSENRSTWISVGAPLALRSPIPRTRPTHVLRLGVVCLGQFLQAKPCQSVAVSIWQSPSDESSCATSLAVPDSARDASPSPSGV